MILSPEQYSDAAALDLLREAARGYVPLDHRFLRAILARGETVLPDFIAFLKEPHEDDRVELEETLVEIARFLKTPAVLPFLAEVARAEEFSFADVLTEAFVDLGADAVDTLIGLYEEGEHASDAAFTLAGLGVRDPRIFGLLTAHLQHDAGDAAIMLGLYGDAAAKPELEKAASATESAETRQEIESAIREIDQFEDYTRPEPFDIFPAYAEEESPLFAAFNEKELIEFTKSPVAAYRAHTVRMLSFDEMTPPIVQLIFDIARKDPDSSVRAFAWEALEGEHESAEIETALRQKIEDTEAPPEERAGALVALAHETSKDEALRKYILEFHENPETRASAIKAMWHSGDRRFENLVAKALDDASLDVQRQGVTAAGMFGMVSQLGRIERLFQNEDLRGTALYAYSLAAPSPVTPARMRKLFHKIEDLADGLNEDESVIVGRALDDRLTANEYDPVFLTEHAWEDEEHEDDERLETLPQSTAKVGRNDPCPCGSGKKHKKCCGQ